MTRITVDFRHFANAPKFTACRKFPGGEGVSHNIPYEQNWPGLYLTPYRAVNTLRLGYKNLSVNDLKGNNRSLHVLRTIQNIRNALCGQNVQYLYVKPCGT